MGIFKEYISEEGKKGIKEFKYKGGSVSIAYEYIWSPFCDWIVKTFIPAYVAPNTITLIASLLVVFAHGVIMWYSPDFQQPIPSWACYLMFVAVLQYQILDNCDGKQARATGTSSPLGMLFDHGCDSVVTWMIGMCIANVFSLQNQTVLYWSVLLLGQIPFYSAQWSQYHVGVFKLGRVNAIDEGLILVQAIFLATAYYGQQIWQIEVAYGLRLGSIIILTVCLLGLLQFLQFAVDTYKECKLQKKSFLTTLSHLECVVLLFLTHLIVFKYTDIHQSPQYIALYVYGLCISWSKVILHIQIAHITKEKFVQWRVTFIVCCAAYANLAFFGSAEYTKIVVLSVLVVSSLAFSHIVYNVTNTMAEVLEIRVFSVQKALKTKNS